MSGRPTPAVPSAVGAAAAGCAVAGIVAAGAGAFAPFAGELAGLALLGAGARSRRTAVGTLALGGGTLIALSAAAVSVGAAADLSGLAVFPGAVGAFVLVAGLAVPLRPRFAVTAGTGSLFASVLAAGALGTVATLASAVGLAGTVLAWDLGERAIDLGEWSGETRVAEVVHAGGSALVGVLGVTAALGSTAFGAVEASLATVLLALLGSVGLAALLGE